MRTFNTCAAALLGILCSLGAWSQSERPSHFLAKQCNEYAIELHLDPRPFRNLVGSEFSLSLEQGRARVLMVVHDCSQYWIDGEDLGSAQDIQVWVSIVGTEDERPVVGAERTQPTKTWFALFVGSTSPRVRASKEASGTTALPIVGITMSGLGAALGGRVIFNGNLNYSWTGTPSPVPSVKLVGVNNDVYFKDAAGHILFNRIQALLRVATGRSQGTLVVAGKTDALPFIGPGTYPVSISAFFPMWSRAALGLAPARERPAKR